MEMEMERKVGGSEWTNLLSIWWHIWHAPAAAAARICLYECDCDPPAFFFFFSLQNNHCMNQCQLKASQPSLLPLPSALATAKSCPLCFLCCNYWPSIQKDPNRTRYEQQNTWHLHTFFLLSLSLSIYCNLYLFWNSTASLKNPSLIDD